MKHDEHGSELQLTLAIIRIERSRVRGLNIREPARVPSDMPERDSRGPLLQTVCAIPIMLCL